MKYDDNEVTMVMIFIYYWSGVRTHVHIVIDYDGKYITITLVLSMMKKKMAMTTRSGRRRTWAPRLDSKNMCWHIDTFIFQQYVQTLSKNQKGERMHHICFAVIPNGCYPSFHADGDADGVHKSPPHRRSQGQLISAEVVWGLLGSRESANFANFANFANSANYAKPLKSAMS